MIATLLEEGGVIAWALLALSIVAGSVAIARTVALVAWRRRLRPGSVLPVDATTDPEIVLATEAARLSRGLTTLRVIAAAAPLLGLLGTVVGLFTAFRAVAAQGLGDPAVFADGIALALTTTIAGLLVALPSQAAHLYLTAAAERGLLELETRLREAAAPPRRALRGVGT